MSGRAKKTKTSKKTTEKSKKNAETVYSDETEEEEQTIKAAPKKTKDEEVEMIAIEYVIPNKKHPFHHLHEVPSSVEVSKLLDKIDREDVSLKKELKIRFLNISSLDFIYFCFKLITGAIDYNGD